MILIENMDLYTAFFHGFQNLFIDIGKLQESDNLIALNDKESVMPIHYEPMKTLGQRIIHAYGLAFGRSFEKTFQMNLCRFAAQIPERSFQ